MIRSSTITVFNDELIVDADDLDCLLNALQWFHNERPWAYGHLGERQRLQLDRIMQDYALRIVPKDPMREGDNDGKIG